MTNNLKAGKKNWSKEAVLDAIHDRLKSNLPINSFAVRLDNEGLWQAAKRYCGSWGSALNEAGVAVKGRPRSDSRRAHSGAWSREIILAKIQEYRDHETPLGAHQMQKVDNRLVSAAGYYFGSWAKALEAAGVNPDAVRSSLPWTSERVVLLIQDAKKSGADLQDRSIRFWNRALYRAACDHFGTWSQAVQAALKENAPEARWNADRVRNLVQDYVAHGFSVNEALRYHPRLLRAIIHHYGSMENFVETLRLPDLIAPSIGDGSLLGTWRQGRGLSLDEMGQILGLSAESVEAYEHGNKSIPWTVFWRWAVITGRRSEALKRFFPKPPRTKNRDRGSFDHAAYTPVVPFSSNSLCFVVDDQGSIRHWSPNLTRLTGVKARESEARPCTDIVRTYLSGAQPFCRDMCPVKSRSLKDDRPPVVHWQNPDGFLVRMHMITDQKGWTAHWIEPVEQGDGMGQ